MLIDSNILIYAINTRSPKHKQAQKLLKDNLEKLEIAHQNVLEAIRVLTHKRYSNPMNLHAALDAILAICESSYVISPLTDTYHLALELIKAHRLIGNKIFDAYLVATALSNGITEIATDNVGDFRKFKGIKIINPFAKIN